MKNESCQHTDICKGFYRCNTWTSKVTEEDNMRVELIILVEQITNHICRRSQQYVELNLFEVTVLCSNVET